MYTYEGTKRNGLNTIKRMTDMLEYSNNHEVNKELLCLMLEATQELLRLEEMQAATEKNDLVGMHNAMNKQWI